MASQFRPTYFSVYLENPHHLCLLLTWWQPTYVLGLSFFWTNKTLLYIFMPFFSYLLFWFKSRLLKRAAYTSHISSIAEFDKTFLSLSSESSSESHSQESQCGKRKYQGECVSRRFSFYGQLSFQQCVKVNPFGNNWFDILGESGGTDGAHQAKGSRNEDKELKETKIFASVLTSFKILI